MNTNAYNGHHVNYFTEGNGPAIILIHGVASSLHQWDYLIPDLVTNGYQVFALDLLGHGESAKPDSNGNGCYHIEAIYAHLANWISRLALKRHPILISHSMGAYLSLIYATRNPGKTRGMALISPYFSPKQLSLPIRLSLKQPRLSTKILSIAPKWTVSSAISIAEWRGEPFTRKVREQMVQDFKRTDPQVITFPKTTQNLIPLLGRVTSPVMIAWGQKDLTLAPSSYPKLIQALPNAIDHPFPNGHNLHLTNVQTFNRQLLSFLEMLLGAN